MAELDATPRAGARAAARRRREQARPGGRGAAGARRAGGPVDRGAGRSRPGRCQHRPVRGPGRKQAAATHGARGRAHLSLAARLTEWAAACRELRPSPIRAPAGRDRAGVRAARRGRCGSGGGLGEGRSPEEGIRHRGAAGVQPRGAGRTPPGRSSDSPAAGCRRNPPPARTTDRTAMTGGTVLAAGGFRAARPRPGPRPGRGRAAGVRAAGCLGRAVRHRRRPRHVRRSHGAGPRAGPFAAEVLVPEHHPWVPADAIQRLLAAIAFGDQLPAGHPPRSVPTGAGGWGTCTAAGTGTSPPTSAQPPGSGPASGASRSCAVSSAPSTVRSPRWTPGSPALADRRTAVANERALRPDHRELNEAAQAVLSASAGGRRSGPDRPQAAGDSVRAGEQVAGALLALTRLAAENGLPADRTALDTLAAAIDAVP